MKTCPSCRKTYEDESLVFCLDDGARLERERGSLDPNATLNLPTPGPTVASPRPAQPTAQSTITSHPQHFQGAQQVADSARSESRRSALPWVFAIVLVLGASGVLIAWLMTRGGADDTSGSRYPAPTPVPTIQATPTPAFALLNNTTFNGGTRITYYQRTSFELCQADCEGNPNCKGLTWIRPGAYNPGDPGMCYLMSAVTDRVSHSCCISAVRN